MGVNGSLREPEGREPLQTKASAARRSAAKRRRSPARPSPCEPHSAVPANGRNQWQDFCRAALVEQGSRLECPRAPGGAVPTGSRTGLVSGPLSTGLQGRSGFSMPVIHAQSSICHEIRFDESSARLPSPGSARSHVARFSWTDGGNLHRRWSQLAPFASPSRFVARTTVAQVRRWKNRVVANGVIDIEVDGVEYALSTGDAVFPTRSASCVPKPRRGGGLMYLVMTYAEAVE